MQVFSTKKLAPSEFPDLGSYLRDPSADVQKYLRDLGPKIALSPDRLPILFMCLKGLQSIERNTFSWNTDAIEICPDTIDTGTVHWQDITASFSRLYQTKDDSGLKNRCSTSELLAAVLYSEVTGTPVICRCTDSIAQSFQAAIECRKDPLRAVLPWDSQRWFYHCASAQALQAVRCCGINPALAAITRPSPASPQELKTFEDTAEAICKRALRFQRLRARRHTVPEELLFPGATIGGLQPLSRFFQAESMQSGHAFLHELQELRHEVFTYAQALGGGNNDSSFRALCRGIERLFLPDAQPHRPDRTVVTDYSYPFRLRTRTHRELWDLAHGELLGLVRVMAAAQNEALRKSQSSAASLLTALQCSLDASALPALLRRYSPSNDTAAAEHRERALQILSDPAEPLAVVMSPSWHPHAAAEILGSVIAARHQKLEGSNPKPLLLFLSAGFSNRVCAEIETALCTLSQTARRRSQAAQALTVEVLPTDQFAEGLNLAQFRPAALQAITRHIKDGGWLLTEGGETLLSLQGLKARWVNVGSSQTKHTAHILGTGLQHQGYVVVNPSPATRSLRGFPVVNAPLLPSLASITQGCEPAADIPVHWTEHQLELPDGEPIHATLLRLSKRQLSEFRLDLMLASTPRTLKALLSEQQSPSGYSPYFAASGGYFIDRRLIARNFLPSELLGCPADLCIRDGTLLSLPIAQGRPTLCVQDSTISIAHFPAHLSIAIDGLPCRWRGAASRIADRTQEPFSVQLGMWSAFPSGRLLTAVDILGDRIVRIAAEDTPVLSCWRLLVPSGDLPAHWAPGVRIPMRLADTPWRLISTAIAAGPSLIISGQEGISSQRIQEENWNHPASRLLQFSPVQMEELRTPRCVCCLLKDGGFGIMVISGRTYESVGATHEEAAQIGQKLFCGDVIEAMEFDCGGSVSCRNAHHNLSILNYIDDGGSLSERPVGNALLLLKRI